MDTIDFATIKKLLLDEYRDEYPNASNEETTAFYTAMTWLENGLDLAGIKQGIKEDMLRKNPRLPRPVWNAFVHGLNRLSVAIGDQSIYTERLQEFLPEKVYNEYLKVSLSDAQALVAENERLKQEIVRLNNILNTWKTMSNSDRSKIRMELEYQRILKELESVKNNLEKEKAFSKKMMEIHFSQYSENDK